MTTPDPEWHDDPITSVAQDTLQRGAFADHAAALIRSGHSWESSVVYGLTGPWGSGKSSTIALVTEALLQQDPSWRVAQFTPWATSDTASLLGEFFNALGSALPTRKGRAARKALSVCASVSAPMLSLIPYIGGAASAAAGLFKNMVDAPRPWHESFVKASAELKKLNSPVLVVVDDIDRLQSSELMGLLKVVRLLGRFPGVHYLLAYDEQTLLASLQGAEAGVADSQRARLFMEKIVQYPLSVPPLLPSQMLMRLNAGLETMAESIPRAVRFDDYRLSHLVRTFESQLVTPRAVDRLIAQLRYYLPMHEVGEVDDADLLLLNFVRMQFPGLYAALPRWKNELTGSRIRSSHFKQEEPSWSLLLSEAPAPDRGDAQQVLEILFPSMTTSSSGPAELTRICNRDYFDRYFAHTIPEGDVADSLVQDALDAAMAGDGSALLALFADDYPGRADLALSKAWNRFDDPSPAETTTSKSRSVTVDLVRVVAACLPELDDGTRGVFSARERGTRWLADLLRQLPASASADAVFEAVRACNDEGICMHAMWSALRESYDEEAPALLREVAVALAGQVADSVLAHLCEQDEASLDAQPLFSFMFVSEYGDPEDLRARVFTALADGRFTVEDLASRFVSLAHSLGRHSVANMHEFEQATFARFAPATASLYDAELDGKIDTSDISWRNRRAFARGRARAPL